MLATLAPATDPGAAGEYVVVERPVLRRITRLLHEAEPPDPRREAREAAIRRLLEAARDIPLPDGMFPDMRPHDELRDAVDALAALDGEGGD